jgi:hypothetical protein
MEVDVAAESAPGQEAARFEGELLKVQAAGHRNLLSLAVPPAVLLHIAIAHLCT